VQDFSLAHFKQYKPKKKNISYHEITKGRNHKKGHDNFRVFVIASIY